MPTHLARIVACLTLVVITTTVLAVPNLSINNRDDRNISVCTPTLDALAVADTAFYGTWTYNWTLLYNGGQKTTASQTLTCAYSQPNPPPCELPSFRYTAPSASGQYQVKLAVFSRPDTYSNEITVVALPGPTAIARINGSAATNVSVSDDGPIKLDGSSSSCATLYFLSIELSDKSWNRFGGEYAKWLTPADYQRYGNISSFNVQVWAEDHGFRFVAGQYYRVKLAVAPPWNERTQLILIMPYVHGPGEVRIRHKSSGKCFYVDTNSNQSVRNWTCWGDANMAFIIDDTGQPGEVRIRHKKTQRCLYGVPTDGGTAKSWGPCWADPNMVFILDSLNPPDVRIRHKATQKCLYGDPTNGAAVRNFTCWNDPNMVLVIDSF